MDKWRADAGALHRLIFEIGAGSVQRPGDWVAFNWGDDDGENLWLTQGKTDVERLSPFTSPLKAVLDTEAARLTPHPARTIITLQDGSPMYYRRMAEIMRR
ncbi:hypothetical protein [Tropicimonas marinistellae]|uniref:hypothetical protein n=1 Tax=Tropicimonas marinistellae TaxID=1739787 RepID=UPI0008336C3B|nr:hypothetical protein [Tropicimonas marinistellae]